MADSKIKKKFLLQKIHRNNVMKCGDFFAVTLCVRLVAETKEGDLETKSKLRARCTLLR